MTVEQFEEIIARGHENARVEFKSGGPRTSAGIQARVTRAAIGMSNHRDGGLVVIGVRENNSTLEPVGLEAAHLDTWSYDDVATAFSSYADPSIEFEFEIFDYNGVNFVLLHIQEFREIPVLCKKQLSVSGQQVLRDGACYVRSFGKTETAEVSTHEDMRALLDLAKVKALRKWFAEGQAAGIFNFVPTPTTPADQESFADQLGAL